MLRPVFERLQELDRRLLRTMRTRCHAPQIEDSVKALGMAGEWGAVWVAVGVNYLVKLAVRRRRPRLRRLPPLAAAPSELSFPSAHATSSLAAAAAMGRVAPGSRPPLYGLAGAICLTRPYLGMHYPSDVLGGAAIGLAIGRLWPGLRGKGAEDRLIDLVASAAPSTAAASPHRSSADGRPQAPASRPSGGRPLSEGDPGRS
jgi:membrane-associated phospholipid phosphatase